MSIMSMEDQRKLIDQMAKMRMNYLQIWWAEYQPYLKYEYHGETKLMGDMSWKESGYVLNENRGRWTLGAYTNRAI
jgi:hypothetical protein